MHREPLPALLSPPALRLSGIASGTWGEGSPGMCGADQPSKKGAERFMERRKFLKTAGLTAAASTTLAAPAIAQSAPALKWRLTSSFPKSLDTIYGGGETFANYVAAATDNKFQIQVFAAGEIAPGLEAANVVSNNSVEICQDRKRVVSGKSVSVRVDLGGRRIIK